MYVGVTRRSAKPIGRVRRSIRHAAAAFLFWSRKAGRRPVLATAVIVSCSLFSILLITAVAGVQEPEVHDELAQLVQADIFAHGRLADPPHPFWQHFETMHVISQPHYQAKYPPAPALFMAAGEKLTGLPIAGVWLAVAFMIVAMGYAMHALLPPSWAVVGTSLVTLRFGIVGDWPHSYWSGAVAAAGGALVLGATARLLKAPRFRDGALLGSGLVLLVFTRPYEGFAYSLPAMAILGWRLCRPSPVRAALWGNAVPALTTVCVLGCAWLGYYNWRVTGSALTLPYVVYEREYSAAPLFVWQKRRESPPTFRHREMERFENQFSMPEALLAQRRWPVEQVSQLASAGWDYLKPTLPLALLGLPLARRPKRRNALLAATLLASMFGAMMLTTWVAPRYLAPATASIFALVTLGLSGLFRMERFGGRAIAAVAVALLIAAVGATAALYVADVRTSSEWWAQKREIRTRLLQMPGNDLVFVRYKPSHNPHTEWVYNGADIDHQPIVWAREMDPLSNEQLRKYFGDRQAWIVLADENPSRLVQWSGSDR